MNRLGHPYLCFIQRGVIEISSGQMTSALASAIKGNCRGKLDLGRGQAVSGELVERTALLSRKACSEEPVKEPLLGRWHAGDFQQGKADNSDTFKNKRPRGQCSDFTVRIGS